MRGRGGDASLRLAILVVLLLPGSAAAESELEIGRPKILDRDVTRAEAADPRIVEVGKGWAPGEVALTGLVLGGTKVRIWRAGTVEEVEYLVRSGWPRQTGINYPLPVSGVARVEVADPDLVIIERSYDGFAVRGRVVGRTVLRTWKSDGQMEEYTLVVNSALWSEAKHEFGCSGEGISVLEVGGRLIIDGWFFSEEAYERAKERWGDRAVFWARPTPAVRQQVAARIADALARKGIRDAQVTSVGGAYLIEGTVSDSAERTAAQKFARAALSAPAR